MPTILSTALLASSDQAATTINTVVRGGNAGHCTLLAVDRVSRPTPTGFPARIRPLLATDLKMLLDMTFR